MRPKLQTTRLCLRHLSTTKPLQPKPNPPPTKPPSLSYLPPPSNNPSPTSLPSVSPPTSALAKTTSIFTSSPPRFLYAAPRFLNLPLNTATPEICILGRSNVGKSTLINALAGIHTSEAGRAHGLSARRGSLAITSSRAGSTKTMNGYGFGTVDLDVLQRFQKEREEENKLLEGGSRSKRREEQKRLKERVPRWRLVMVDMPGYGLNSRDEWGVEVEKYLGRRGVLKGAVVLIDAVAGVKEGDVGVLEMLRDIGVRTQVVLTKGDKVGYEEGRLDGVCREVWDTLRKVEGRGVTWAEGRGWEREIFVTGAGDPVRGGGLGVQGARWAICRLAGLVEDERVAEKVVVKERKIVSFEDLTYAVAREPRETKEHGVLF
ncbi:hypothetical protein OQA88_9007 [Cercophora sp. LCS_1]